MRLISCYIENFGKISKKEIKFNRNIMSVYEGNGYGKTTLAAFLNAMFYGMDSVRSNSKEFGARKKFYPFDGGLFGGNVVFSVGDNIYKIERYFDEKSDTKDKFTLYKNNDVCYDFGSDCGEHIFGIDKQSFERTVFVTADEIELGSTGSINAKLNNFVEGVDDNTNAEKALERLERVAKEYKKSRGSGLIEQEHGLILDLDNKIDNIKTIKAGLSERYDCLVRYDGESKLLRQRIDMIQKDELELKDWEQYDALIVAAECAEAEKEEVLSKYPAGLPTTADMAELKKALSTQETLQAQKSKIITSEDANRLSQLEETFADDVPSDEDIACVDVKIGNLVNLQADISSAESNVFAEYKQLCERFATNPPTADTIAQIREEAKCYDEAERAYVRTPDYIISDADDVTLEKKSKTNKTKFIIAAVVAVVFAVVGISVIFAQVVVGAVLLAIGVISLVGIGFLYLNKKANTTVPIAAVQRINPDKMQKERERNEIELKIRQQLSVYGYTSDGNVHYIIEKFENDYSSYVEQRRQGDEREKQLEQKREEISRLNDELRQYFSKYRLHGNDFRVLNLKLQQSVSEYKTIISTQKKLNEQNAQTNISIEKQEQDICAICEKYALYRGDVIERIPSIESDIAKYSRAIDLLETNEKNAKKLKKEKKLEKRPTMVEKDVLEELKTQSDSLSKEMSTLRLEINDFEAEAEKLDDLSNEKERHKERLEEFKNKHRLITAAVELLEKSEKQLKDRYISPIKNNFLQYTGMLEKALGEKIVMTANFELRYERNGIERSFKHLSSGQRRTCAFCLRMALIENMYPDEKPFLILDDPFVHLDSAHLERMKNVLKDLSERMQLLYFTCHDSRAL